MNNNIDQEKSKKKIVWITPDYFVDCDFNSDLFLGILKSFQVHWLVLLPSKNARYSEKNFESLKELPGLKIEFIYWTCRGRSPKMLLFYEKVYQRIKSLKPDLIYLNDTPTNPYALPLYWRLNKRTTIFTAHDGDINASFKMASLSKIVFHIAYSNCTFINNFSITQQKLFKSNFDKAKTFLIPLGLKDYGSSPLPKRKDNIVFFFFGSIISNKNLELLIDAACNLYEKGIRGFKISINGYCNNWEYYKLRIKYPDIFECDIRLIENSEIPGLFSENHYMVFPYKTMSQSGALKLAFNYGIPVIVSDLESFTDEVKEGINGFIFKSENINELESVMIKRIENHSDEYKLLNEKVLKYNQDHYSSAVLASKYINMFNSVLNSNE